MKRILLPLAATLSLCAGLAQAEPSNRGNFAQNSPENRSYLSAHRTRASGWSRSGLTHNGWSGTPRTGSHSVVLQTGVNNKTTIRQHGDNKTAVVIQQGSDTEVIINQRGDRPGGAWVVTW